MGQDVFPVHLVVEQIETVGRCFLRFLVQLPLKHPDLYWCFQTHRQSPLRSSFSSAPEARALPSASITRHRRYRDPLRLPGRPSSFDDVGDAISAGPGSPPITQITFPACRAQYPGGPNRCLSVSSPFARPSPVNWRVGIHDFTFEACSGFTRVTACKVAAHPTADSCPEASTRPVTRPDRSVATMSYRQLHRWILLPPVICAFGAHVESRKGAVPEPYCIPTRFPSPLLAGPLRGGPAGSLHHGPVRFQHGDDVNSACAGGSEAAEQRLATLLLLVAPLLP